MEMLSGLGHVPQREQPEEIARRVADFLAAA
jgi:pimeloyl-ACP methyl ester carboxylesterase